MEFNSGFKGLNYLQTGQGHISHRQNHFVLLASSLINLRMTCLV